MWHRVALCSSTASQVSVEHCTGAVPLTCWHVVTSTHTRNTRSAVLEIFTRLSGLCSQSGAECESLVHWGCCCAFAAYSYEVLTFCWHHLWRGCGSAVLAARLLGWPSSASAAGLICPGGAGPGRLLGCLVLGTDVRCRVSVTCHSATYERGGDGHPSGLL